jgi:hypothetical protein
MIVPDAPVRTAASWAMDPSINSHTLVIWELTIPRHEASELRMVTAKISESSHLPFRGDRNLTSAMHNVLNSLITEFKDIINPEFLLSPCHAITHRPTHFGPQQPHLGLILLE